MNQTTTDKKPGGLDETTSFNPRFDAHGLLPVIVSDAASGQVLMLAYMNQEALELTLQTGDVHFWSRSHKKLWRKGEESGNRQRVVEMLVDCDQDTLLLRVTVNGTEACCHTGRKSCFYRSVPLGEAKPSALTFVDSQRLFDPAQVYSHAGAAKGTLKSST